MKKILIALMLVTSVTVASAQTKKPAAPKANAKKESCEAKKECGAKEEVASCCSPGSRTKAVTAAKKVPAKKG